MAEQQQENILQQIEAGIENISITTSNSKAENEYDPEWLKGTSAEVLLKKNSSKPENDFSHAIYKTLSLLNGKINNMSAMELVKCLKELKLDYKLIKFNLLVFFN